MYEKWKWTLVADFWRDTVFCARGARCRNHLKQMHRLRTHVYTVAPPSRRPGATGYNCNLFMLNHQDSRILGEEVIYCRIPGSWNFLANIYPGWIWIEFYCGERCSHRITSSDGVGGRECCENVLNVRFWSTGQIWLKESHNKFNFVDFFSIFLLGK